MGILIVVHKTFKLFHCFIGDKLGRLGIPTYMKYSFKFILIIFNMWMENKMLWSHVIKQ